MLGIKIKKVYPNLINTSPSLELGSNRQKPPDFNPGRMSTVVGDVI
jgi:hypothetical protein